MNFNEFKNNTPTNSGIAKEKAIRYLGFAAAKP
jgi:hypothetical protein